MTGCAATPTLPQAEIQRSALSTDEVHHALSMRIAVPLVVKEEEEKSVKEDVKEEEKKDEEREEKEKEEKEKEMIKAAPIEETPVRIQEENPVKAQEETPVEEHVIEETVKASGGDCCIVL